MRKSLPHLKKRHRNVSFLLRLCCPVLTLSVGMFLLYSSYFCLCVQDICVCTNVRKRDINWRVCRGSDFPWRWLCIST